MDRVAACGHDPAQFVTADEGTSYCPACEAEARCVCGEINTRHCQVHGQGDVAAKPHSWTDVFDERVRRLKRRIGGQVTLVEFLQKIEDDILVHGMGDLPVFLQDDYGREFTPDISFSAKPYPRVVVHIAGSPIEAEAD